LVAPWVDGGLEALRELVSMRKEMEVIDEALGLLNKELRLTTQRVNLLKK